MKRIIKNTAIITMSVNDEKVFKGDIAINGDKIEHIGKIPDTFIPEEVIDGSMCVTMPGLVNAHTHMAMSLMRNYADDLPLMTWLSEKIWPIEAELVPSDVFDGTMLSIAELIRSGSTTFNDMYFEMDEVAKAVDKSGIRAVLSRGLIGNDTEGHEKILDAKAFHRKWHGKSNGRIRVDIAPHAPYTCSDVFLKMAIEAAKDLDCQIHIHLSESKDEVVTSKKLHGMTPIERMEKLGMFDVKTSAAHCVHLEAVDFDILKKYEVSVLNNPSSNLKLGNGFAKINQMLSKGINVALGTDGSSSNNNVNMFEEMHLCGLINKGIEEDPTVLPAYKVLEIATINGAKALGIDSEVGSLEVGKKADLIMIDLQKPHLNPHFDLIATLVYSASGSDVKHVMCNGEWLMRDNQILTFDEMAMIDRANKSVEKLVDRANKKGQ